MDDSWLQTWAIMSYSLMIYSGTGIHTMTWHHSLTVKQPFRICSAKRKICTLCISIQEYVGWSRIRFFWIIEIFAKHIWGNATPRFSLPPPTRAAKSYEMRKHFDFLLYFLWWKHQTTWLLYGIISTWKCVQLILLLWHDKGFIKKIFDLNIFAFFFNSKRNQSFGSMKTVMVYSWH